MLARAGKVGLQILRFLGHVGVAKDLPWYIQAVRAAVGATLAAVASVSELVAEMHVVWRVVFIAALLLGSIGIVGAVWQLGRNLWVRYRSGEEGTRGSYDRITVNARNIGNLIFVSGQETEDPPTDEIAVSASEQTQSQELTPSGHPAPQPLPPDAVTRNPLRDLSFRITELESESPRMIRDRIFEDCFIHGPAILVLDQSPLYEADCSPKDAESLLWDTGDRRHLAGVLAIKHCVFRGCTFVGIGFAGPPQFIQEFRDALEAASIRN